VIREPREDLEKVGEATLGLVAVRSRERWGTPRFAAQCFRDVPSSEGSSMQPLASRYEDILRLAGDERLCGQDHGRAWRP